MPDDVTDLVQRLRESVRACRALDRSALLTEAADEIARLRAALQACLPSVAQCTHAGARNSECASSHSRACGHD